MPPTTAASLQRPDLNWLRAIAVVEVVLAHSDLAIKHFSTGLMRSGGYVPFSGIGVEIFFILSGYLICLRAPAYASCFAFLRSRALRIFPLYVIFTLLALLARFLNPNWVWNGYDLSAGTLIRSILILPQSWFPVVGVGWSLEHEIIFYELTGAMIAAFGLAGRRGLAFGGFLVVLGWIGIGLGVPPIEGTWYQHPVSVLMIAFALGWLYRCHEAGQEVRQEVRQAAGGDALPLAVLVLAIAGTGVMLTFADPANAEKVLRIAGSAAICLLLVRQRRRIVPGGLADQIVAPIGAAAYSIYLSHWFVLSVLGKLAGHAQLPADAALAVRAAAIALSLGVGLIVYAGLERPLDLWLRAGRTARQAFAPWRTGLRALASLGALARSRPGGVPLPPIGATPKELRPVPIGDTSKSQSPLS